MFGYPTLYRATPKLASFRQNSVSLLTEQPYQFYGCREQRPPPLPLPLPFKIVSEILFFFGSVHQFALYIEGLTVCPTIRRVGCFSKARE